jgi:hypothetical protein
MEARWFAWKEALLPMAFGAVFAITAARGPGLLGGLMNEMLDPAKVAETLKQKPEMVHVILTGRNAHPLLVEIADTVTEMREVKHAYQKGILAQRGIEY